MNSRCFIRLMLGKVVSGTSCPRSLFQLTNILHSDQLAVIDSILEITVQTWYCQLEGLPVWEERCVYLGNSLLADTSTVQTYTVSIFLVVGSRQVMDYSFISFSLSWFCFDAENPWLRRLLLGKPQMSGSGWEALTPTSCFSQFIHSLLAALSDTRGSRLAVLQMVLS